MLPVRARMLRLWWISIRQERYQHSDASQECCKRRCLHCESPRMSISQTQFCILTNYPLRQLEVSSRVFATVKDTGPPPRGYQN